MGDEVALEFKEVTIRAVKLGRCPVCRKKARRASQFGSYGNNPIGGFVAAKLRAEEWGRASVYHVKCEPQDTYVDADEAVEVGRG